MYKNKFNILIVEDDEQINDAIKIYLLKEEYNVSQAYNGKEALDKFTCELVDLILLDISLPEIDGMDILKQIRATSNVPIIILTVFSKEYNKLQGFNLGADDYITKPFSLKEVNAIIQAILKRVKKVNITNNSCINVAKIRINTFTREVFVGNNELSLTNKDINDFRTVDTHIKQLREKLGSEKECIQTVWGIGYKFKVIKNE